MTSSLKLTWQAINEIARRANSTTISFSSRQLAEATGVSHMTAAKNINKLIGMGALTKTAASRPGSGLAPTYQVHQNVTLLLDITNAKERSSVNIWCDALQSYPTAAIVFNWLIANDGATASEVARAIGIHRNTARRALKRLEAMGLLDARYQLTGLSLEEAAERIGATGALEVKRAKHNQQRTTYKENAMSNTFGSHIKLNTANVKESEHCWFYNDTALVDAGRYTIQVFKSDTKLVDLLTQTPSGTVLYAWLRPSGVGKRTLILDDAMLGSNIYNIVPSWWEESPTAKREVERYESDRKKLVYA